MKNWLRVYKFPEVERTTYDRYECTAEHQIYPYIGKKPVCDITPADIKKLLAKHMNAGYAFTTSKKAYSILKMFFKQLYQEGAIPNNPMAMIDMIKKDNYLAAQNKESKSQCDLVVVFTDDELEKIKAEAFKRFANGKPVPSPKKQTKNTREKPNEKNDKYDIKLLYSTAFIPRFA